MSFTRGDAPSSSNAKDTPPGEGIIVARVFAVLWVYFTFEKRWHDHVSLANPCLLTSPPSPDGAPTRLPVYPSTPTSGPLVRVKISVMTKAHVKELTTNDAGHVTGVRYQQGEEGEDIELQAASVVLTTGGKVIFVTASCGWLAKCHVEVWRADRRESWVEAMGFGSTEDTHRRRSQARRPKFAFTGSCRARSPKNMKPIFDDDKFCVDIICGFFGKMPC